MTEQEENKEKNNDCCGEYGHHGHGRNHGHGEWGWWEERSLFQKILAGIGFGILGICALFAFGWVVMLLWNALIPDIFGLGKITYWQAWGILALSTILFKGGGSSHGGGKRSEWKRKRALRGYMRNHPEEKNSSDD